MSEADLESQRTAKSLAELAHIGGGRTAVISGWQVFVAAIDRPNVTANACCVH